MLTKSDLASFRQCPRKLWLEHHRPDLVPQNDPTLWRRANDGNIVGAKARELLSQNVIWPKGGDDRCAAASAAITQLSANPGQPAVEVPMFRDGLYARADALIPSPAGGYILRETKASTFPLKPDKVTPGTPEEHHLDDVAIQAWIAEVPNWHAASHRVLAGALSEIQAVTDAFSAGAESVRLTDACLGCTIAERCRTQTLQSLVWKRSLTIGL
jgi:hypothetical protein